MCLFQKDFSYTSFDNSQIHKAIPSATYDDIQNFSSPFTIQFLIQFMPLTLYI